MSRIRTFHATDDKGHLQIECNRLDDFVRIYRVDHEERFVLLTIEIDVWMTLVEDIQKFWEQPL